MIPFTVAGAICFAAAFILGAVAWYLFGTKRHAPAADAAATVQTSRQNAAEPPPNGENTNQPAAPAPPVAAATPPEIRKAPAGEVKITGGEVMLGGDLLIDGKPAKLPLRRVAVADFFVGETEVTNAQYAAFLAAAEYKAPVGWKDGKFAPRAADEPVSGIAWADADAYCDWLSKEIGATVRLPTEAEWERAARGDAADNKYPWGSDWSDAAAFGGDAAAAAGGEAKIFPVKNFSAGRTREGVYEMVGNVWEWTGDLAVDEFGKPVLFEKSRQRIIKGGSAKESLHADERKNMAIDAHFNRPENKPSEFLGFRYVVIRK